MRLLAYISDKDLFAEFFRKKLARRLLNQVSASDEHERSILSRLKQQCGAQFTSKVSLQLCFLSFWENKKNHACEGGHKLSILSCLKQP